MIVLSVNDRLDWLLNHPTKNADKKTWKEGVAEIKKDLYSFSFNHPLYGGSRELSDDEARHNVLDNLNVPRNLYEDSTFEGIVDGESNDLDTTKELRFSIYNANGFAMQEEHFHFNVKDKDILTITFKGLDINLHTNLDN